jgi:hypothetical protein
LFAKEEILSGEAVVRGTNQRHEVQKITCEKEHGANHPCQSSWRLKGMRGSPQVRCGPAPVAARCQVAAVVNICEHS